MGTQIRILGLGIGTGVLVMALGAWNASGWYPISGMCGRMAAERDVRHGVYRVLRFGITTPGMPHFAELVRARYGIEVEAVAACTASPSERDYADAYDTVSQAAIRARFGRDVVRETWDEAAAAAARKTVATR